MTRLLVTVVVMAALSPPDTVSGETAYRCWTPAGTSGTCQSLRRCSRNSDYISVLQSIQSRLCYWHRGQPFICCPTQGRTETTREVWPTFATIGGHQDRPGSSPLRPTVASLLPAVGRQPENDSAPQDPVMKADSMPTVQPFPMAKDDGVTLPTSGRTVGKPLDSTELEKICGRSDPEVLADAESAEVLRQLYPEIDPLFAVSGGAFGKEARVTGGFTSVRGRWPWMAVIGRQNSRNNVTWLCGASVIDEHHVLTAAHCCRGRPNVVRVGGSSIGSAPAAGATLQRRRIGKITVHPRYRPPRLYHDLAVITLRRPLTFGRFVRPVCLPTADLRLRRGQTARIAGHGYTEYNHGKLADELQEAEIQLVQRKFCNASYTRLGDIFLEKYPHGVLSHVLCAGHKDGGVDACQGDSGGPLMQHDDTTDAYIQIGVISSGLGCGNPDYPGLYVSVKHHLQFIHAVRANLAERLSRRAQQNVVPRTDSRRRTTQPGLGQVGRAALPAGDVLTARTLPQAGRDAAKAMYGNGGSVQSHAELSEK